MCVDIDQNTWCFMQGKGTKYIYPNIVLNYIRKPQKSIQNVLGIWQAMVKVFSIIREGLV